MSRWRIAVVVFLLAAPALSLAALGSYFLWIEGLGFTVWWPMLASMALAYFLGWFWLRNRQRRHWLEKAQPVLEEDGADWQSGLDAGAERARHTECA